MRGYQKLIVAGHLGKDPEVRYTQSGDAVASFSVAVGESWKDKATGEKRERTEWFNCSAFGRLGEVVGEYLKKGSAVMLEGTLRTDGYTDNDGNKRKSTKFIVNEMRMLGDGEKKDGQQQGQPRQQSQQARGNQTSGNNYGSTRGEPPPDDDFDDQIPF